MKPTVEQRLMTLAAAYAEQRKALRENGAAIKQVSRDAECDYFDLRPIRERYWTGECHDLMLGEVIVWHGWLHAVETCDPDNENGEDCGYRATAILMDARRDILRNGARIRAEITKIGAKLLRAGS